MIVPYRETPHDGEPADAPEATWPVPAGHAETLPMSPQQKARQRRRTREPFGFQPPAVKP